MTVVVFGLINILTGIILFFVCVPVLLVGVTDLPFLLVVALAILTVMSGRGLAYERRWGIGYTIMASLGWIIGIAIIGYQEYTGNLLEFIGPSLAACYWVICILVVTNRANVAEIR
jgi:hypothetical protein